MSHLPPLLNIQTKDNESETDIIITGYILVAHD